MRPRKNPSPRAPQQRRTVSIKDTIAGRMKFTVVFLLAGIVVLVGRLFVLQIIDGKHYSEMNVNQMTDTVTVLSARGAIYDRNKRPLAESVLVKSLYADPAILANDKNNTPQDVAKLIGPYVDMKPEALLAALEDKESHFIWLHRLLDQEDYLALRKIIKEHKIEGLNFIPENKRYYPNDVLLAQTLGFVGTDDKGLEGLEYEFNEYIHGNAEKKTILRDNRGNPILKSVFTSLLPQEQKSLQLTIDTTVQYIAEKALDEVMEKNKPDGATIIIMDPKTGEILALANRPTFDPAHFGKASPESFKNRAVGQVYEAGSTFKPIVAAIALDTGRWKIDEVYDDKGYLAVSDAIMKNWDGGANGKVTLLEILKYSINTGMGYIGIKVGPELLMKQLRAFGFLKKTGIELSVEETGIPFNKKDSDLVDIETANTAIGQGIAITPIQLVQAFGALANDGKMMQPHIVKGIYNPDGSVYKEMDIKEVGTPIKPKVAEEITNILEQEISAGGGRRAMVEGYRFAGKTGTAQKVNPQTGRYYEGRYMSSFIGYGPLPDARFVMLVVVDTPRGVYYGAEVAAPIFKEVMTQLVRYYHISPSQITQKSDTQPRKPWTSPKVVRTEDNMIIVPDFSNWTMAQVQEWIEKAKLHFRPEGSGYGYSQKPAGGNLIEEGGIVTVYFKE